MGHLENVLSKNEVLLNYIKHLFPQTVTNPGDSRNDEDDESDSSALNENANVERAETEVTVTQGKVVLYVILYFFLTLFQLIRPKQRSETRKDVVLSKLQTLTKTIF